MLDVEVIDDPAAAVVALDPVRSRLLSELSEPASAATLAARLRIARQKVNYHLRALEEHQLVRVAEKRKWGGLTERLLVATAASYVVSPRALGPAGADPDRERDRLSQAISSPWPPALFARSGLSCGVQKNSASVCPPCRSTPWFGSGRQRIAPRSAATSPRPSQRWSRAITMHQRPVAARIVL